MTSFGRTKVKKTSKSIQVYRIRESPFSKGLQGYTRVSLAVKKFPPRAMMGIESCGMLLSAVNNLKDSEDEELHLLMVDDHIPAGAKLY